MDQKLEEKDYEKVYKEIVDSVEELEIPDCLQPESIKKMIKKSKQQKSGHRKWEWAAAIVLVAVGVTAMGVHRLSMPQLQLQLQFRS